MAKSLAELKRKSKTEKISDLAEKLETLDNKKKYEPDDRFWTPTVDASGNSSALIRFLPAPPGEEMPFVKMFTHFFKGPTGKFYVENSLTTLNQKDPVSEYNTKLWNSGLESDKQKARDQKRKLSYFSNILVINDPKNPENNGKVFLFKYGEKIMNKINDAMFPPEDDLEPQEEYVPFDFWDGAEFKLVVRTEKGKNGTDYRSYDQSIFINRGPISTFKNLGEEEYDQEVDKIWKKCSSLTELVSPSQFKDYETLKAKLHDVLAISDDSSVSRETTKREPKPLTEEELKDYTEDEEDVPSTDFDDLEDIAALLNDSDDIPF